MLYKNQWKDSEVVNTDQAQVINLYLSKLLADIRRVIIKMQDNGCINLDEIQAELNRLKNSDITFIDYCKKRAEIRKYGKSEDTKQRYDRFIRLFMSWGHIKTFNDITESNIIDYDKYLASNGMKAYSKWNNYHRFLNSFIIDAINEGYLVFTE